MFPPGLTPSVPPLARMTEEPANWTASEAYNSITPFCWRTELAWINPLLLTVCACKSTWPASATILPWLSTLPAGSCTGADKLNPSGRSESNTCWPAISAAVPPGAAIVPLLSICFAIKNSEPPDAVWREP